MNGTNENPVVLFGETNFRNRRVNFGIKMDDRRRHMYVIGKTGMGKSELLKTLAIQDIQAGRGLAFIDPHGDPVEDLLDYIPEERIKDVVYVNPADLDFPVAFNVMEHVEPDKRPTVADGVMGVFKKIWVDVWSSRMEYILSNTILALLEMPDATLLAINRMFAEKEFRKKVVERLTDPMVKAFWTQEFAKYTERFAAEATPAIQNKVGQFISSPLVRNIIGQQKSTLDMRKIMDEGKILLVNISKGRIGEDASRLLGALIITKIQLAAMSRVDISERERKDFVLIVDEFQNFATASFATILSEARKYHLSLIVAHQYVAQMDETVRDAVFGNVGSILSFRVGAEDAELLEKELSPEFMATDIVNLGKRQIYLKLMIDGVASRAFSAMTMDTPVRLAVSNRQRIIEYSRAHYGRSRKDVEKDTADWYATSSEEEAPEERFGRSGASAPRSGWRDQGSSYGGQGFQSEDGRRDTRPRFSPRVQDQRPQYRTGPGLNSEYQFSGPRDQGGGYQSQKQGSGTQPQRQPQRVSADLQAASAQKQPPAVNRGPVSLADALKKGPVDFRGRPIEPRSTGFTGQTKSPRPKIEADLDGLRQVLKESLNKE